MTRDLTTEVATALQDADLRPIVLFEGEFASGLVRVWSGLGELSWDGKIWTGLGTLLSFGALEESDAVVASGTTVSLSAVPLEMVGIAIDEARQGKPGRLWLGFLDAEHQVIADPVKAFAGRLDVPELTESAESCTLTISYESRLIDLNTSRSWRYTDQSQQALFPGDLGFAHVTTIQDKEVIWGRG